MVNDTEGWFVTVRGLYWCAEHGVTLLGWDGDLVKTQPTRYPSRSAALAAAAAVKQGLKGRDANLPVRVVERRYLLSETAYDLSGRRAPEDDR